jgi:hypothetical protein
LFAAVVAFITLPGVPGQPQFTTSTGSVAVSLLQPNKYTAAASVVVDVKSMLSPEEVPASLTYWSL